MTRTARFGFTVTLALPVLLLAMMQLIGLTLTGRCLLFAIESLLLTPLALLWLPRPRPAVALLLILAVLSSAVAIRRSPPSTPPQAALTAHSLRAGGFAPLRLVRLFPEGDQVAIGTYLVPFVHSMSFRSAARLRGLMGNVHREIEQDSAFQQLEPVTDLAIADLAHVSFDSGHVYQYVPPHEPGEKLPAVIFLHGFLGNLKAYFWAMKRLADRYHCVVVLPSFGAGLWYQKGGVDAIEQAREYAIQSLPVDRSRIYLVGLSAGGLGVTRAGLAHPTHYAGLGYLSAAMEEELFEKPAFLSGWSGRPILVVYGGKDDFISPSALRRHTAFLEQQGPQVTRHVYPAEDHYLILSQVDDVNADIARWMGLSRR
jgi:pimeloyl-ACP methyl ester carboxylesterase